MNVTEKPKTTNALATSQFGLSFHHFGLAVATPEPAQIFLNGLGYKLGAFIHDPLQNVHLALCHHPLMPAVEIIHPAEGPGPLDKLMTQAREGLIYHLCYTAQDTDAAIDAMEDAGLRPFCVSPPKPAILFAGQLVSFYMITGVGLVEFIHLAS